MIYINFIVLIKEDNKLEEMELELGTLLKKARKEKGLTLDDIQDETKIRKKYLEAIEENKFDILPGNVYLKVFVKGFAREVGINYQALLENYEILSIEEEKESNLHKDYLGGTKVAHGSNNNNNNKNPLKLILIILLSLFLIGAGIYAYQYFSNSEIRLLNQNTTQQENIEEQSEVLEVEESNQEVETNNSEENNINLSEETNNSENSSDILDSLDSSILSEQNTEFINQNQFDSFDGIDSEESDKITEIIVSEDINNEENFLIEESENSQLNQNENTDNISLNNNSTTTTDTENDNSAENEVENTENDELENEEELSNGENDNELQESNLEEDIDETVEENAAQIDRTVSLMADDTVWITVTVDGENVFSGILEDGDQQEFEIDNRFYIKVGNGSAITASINGEEYGPWAGDGEIAEAEILIEDQQISVNNLRE